MCRRYYRRSDKQRIAEAFKVGKLPPGFELPPDFNIAPSTFQPIIRPDPETGEREMVMMRWGLVPAKVANPDSFKIFSTTNARTESILEKPIWRGPFQHTRCLVPIDGFYEWLQRPSLPQPPPIEPGEHGLFGDIQERPKRIPKPKAGSRPVYKFEMPDGAPSPGWSLLRVAPTQRKQPSSARHLLHHHHLRERTDGADYVELELDVKHNEKSTTFSVEVNLRHLK